MLELIYLSKDNFDPKDVYDIDLKSSIVASVLETNNVFKDDNYHLCICAKNDIMLQNLKIIGNTTYVLDYNPNIKWSVPKGVDLAFNVPSLLVNDFTSQSFIDTIWYDEEPALNNLMSFKFCLHLDKERTKSATKIMMGQRLVEVYTIPTLFNSGHLDNIYIIQNNYIYEEFKLHFDRTSC